MAALDARPFAQVRTYHPRRGRQGVRRREVLYRFWPRFCIGVGPTPLDPAALFGPRALLVLETGSGMGRTTVEMTAAGPGIGGRGVAGLLALVEERG